MLISLSEMQELNAHPSILVREEGSSNVTIFNEWHFPKVESLMISTLAGIDISLSAVQSPKAHLPRYSREDGKMTRLNEVHPQKANRHMRETEGGKITSFEFLHSKNASFPIYFIDVGISIFELSSLQFVNLNISS